LPSAAVAGQIASAATTDATNSSLPAPTNGTPAQSNSQPNVQPNVIALATAILAKSAAGTKTFDIRMDPPELGRVDVHLSVDRDGKVQALLSAEHPQTLAILQRDSQNLERALKDAGLNLSNNSLNFSLKGEGRQGDGGGAFTARARSLPNAVVARAEAANASEINLSSARGNGRLDIRV
jgi:flagellar hook-length control protein FliK